MKSVLIVTGEASGDLHGSNLVKAMAAMDPTISFSGMGGDEMAAAGVELLFDAEKVSVVGIAEVISHLPDIVKAQRTLRRFLRDNRPDLLIIIDLPDFNLMLAKVARSLAVPVFYYISPQVWAWRTGRVKTIANRVDTVGVILPFEEQFLRQRGVAAQYVGHPLLDSVKITKDPQQFRLQYGLDNGLRNVGLLPGSRRREITTLLPIFLEAALRLEKNCGEKFNFLLPLASTIKGEQTLSEIIANYHDQLQLTIVTEGRYNLMKSCSAVVAASGTVTLELAILDVPMVVTYKLAPLTYQLGKILIQLDHFSLVNLIAQKEVVPELLQAEVTPQAIAAHLQSLLTNEKTLGDMREGLETVRNRLGGPGASEKAAALALKMLGGK